MKTDQLIHRLVKDAEPVRRLWPPWLRAGLWLCAAAAITLAMAAHHGFKPDLPEKFRQSGFVMEWAAALITAIFAAVAAFQVSLPDRDPRWALLPIPALAAWTAGMGWGCYADWLRLGPAGLALGESFFCFGFITLLSLPLSLILAYLLRYAALLRPGLTSTLGMLSIAALTSCGLSLFHALDTTLLVIIWHGLTIVLLVALARAVGPWVLRRALAAAAIGGVEAALR